MHKIITLLLFLTFINTSFATEVDNFTMRDIPLRDSLKILNKETNRLLMKAIFKVNNSSSGVCNKSKLYKAVKKQFVRPLWSKFETYITKSRSIDKHAKPYISVYHYFKFFSTSPSTMNIPKQAPIIRVGDVILGADKFSHFFNEGWNYFKKAYLKNKGIVVAFKYGDWMERGFWGAGTMGIYSYGDVAANYKGMLFFMKLLGEHKALGSYAPDVTKPYINCQDGYWYQIRDMDWSEYLDDAFDEAVNCSKFRSEKLTKLFKRRLSELSRETGKSMACPVKRSSCKSLGKKYDRLGKYFINPVCRE